MPSSDGVGAANQQLGNTQGIMNLILQLTQGNTNLASEIFRQFAQSDGPFKDNPLLGMGGASSVAGQAQNFRDGLQNPLSNFQLPPQMQSLFDALGQGVNNANFNIANGGQTGDTQALRQMLTGIFNGQTGPQAGMQAFADNTMGNQGMTNSMTDALGKAQGLTNFGGMTDNLQNLSNTGSGILSRMGYGPETQGAMDFFSNIMQNGGRDAGTQGLEKQGQSLMSNGGFTPQMSQLLSSLQGGMASGGMTPQSQQLYDKMMGIVNNNGQGGSLLPMNSVLSMARDQAATAGHNVAEAAARSAMQRQGSSVGAGTVNQAMSEFADKNMQNQAGAVQNAALGQQDLQLKQLLGAAGIGGDLTKSASSLLGQYASNASDLMKTGASNISTGAGLMGQGESLAATRMGQGISGFDDTIKNTLARLGLGDSMVTGAQTAANQRMGMGLDSTRGINQDAFSNQSFAAKLYGMLTDQSLQAGQGLNTLTSTEFGHENDAYKNLLGLTGMQNGIFTGQQNAALQGNSQYLDAFLKSLGIQGDTVNSFNNNWMNAGNGLTNIAQIFGSMFPSAMNGYTAMGSGLINSNLQPGFWGQFASQLLGAGTSALTGGLRGVFSGPRGGSSGGNGYGTGSATPYGGG